MEKAYEDWMERHLQKKVSLNTLQESLNQTQQHGAPQCPEGTTQVSSSSRTSQSQTQGRGKGRGKGSSSVSSQGKGGGGGKGKSKGKGVQSQPAPQPPHFNVVVWCKFCHRKGHYEDSCWTKQKEERKARAREKEKGATPSPLPPQDSKKRKFETIHVLQGTSLTTDVNINGTILTAISDSGATTSAIAKRCVPEGVVSRTMVVPIQVGNGDCVFSEGVIDLALEFGESRFKQPALVVPTTAFQAVLGMDFLQNPKVGGLLTQPPPCKLLVDGKCYPLSETHGSQIHRIYRMFKKESYTLVPRVKKEVLEALEVDELNLKVDLFANHQNFQEPKYCTRQNNAFFYDWSKLVDDKGLVWCNPPFTQLDRVLTKLALEPTRMVLVCPDWGDCHWRRLLESMACAQVRVPSGMGLYRSDFNEKPMPPPQWSTIVSVLDSQAKVVPIEQLDPEIVKWVRRKNRGWDFAKLVEEVRKYPRPSFDGMEREVQTDEVFESPPVSPISLSPSFPSRLFHCQVGQKVVEEVALGAELSLEVDLSFTKKDYIPPPKVPDMEEVPFVKVESIKGVVETRGIPSSPFLVSKKDMFTMVESLLQHIPVPEKQGISPFDKETENLHGDLQGDLALFDHEPNIKPLLNKYLDIFGPLPPPGAGCQLVECDLELRDEFKGKVIRSKCWPMSDADASEIQKQVQELVDNGLVESYPKGKTPMHCSPTFLVEKKQSSSKRMVGQYQKVNQMTKHHSGFLPSLEGMVEAMAGCRWKSKLDLRSGFWQVGMSEKAKELTTFVTPNGQVWRWNCMPFGIQVAPAIFQNLMERIIAEVKENPKVAKLMEPRDGQKQCFLGAFFDDVGVGSSTKEEHFFILEELFKVVQRHKLRIKLSKCDLVKEGLEYLGFAIQWGSWRPSDEKAKTLAKFKVRSLKDLRAFLGACNFFRRHVKSFTYSSAQLTDLLKKNARFVWSEKEEALIEEIKHKLLTATPLGVPRSTGEMVVVTDASDRGGGGTVFQWQSINPSQVPQGFRTHGMSKDGELLHNYPKEFRLVPIGHWNWKWCPTRSRYSTFEKELLAGVLIFSTQSRILQNLPVVWFCDHEALKHFLDKEPPVSSRLRRWFCFLGQFKIKFVHIPGMKNEWCDWLSRSTFEEKFNLEFENLAKEAFEKMDSQLDLTLKVLSFELKDFNFPLDYSSSEFSSLWSRLEPWKAELVDDAMWFKAENKLFCERKLVIPEGSIPKICLWLHRAQGHPGVERTLWSFLQTFHSSLMRKELAMLFKNVLGSCETCVLSNPSTEGDRGLLGCLPIPPLCNDTIFLDFVALDEYNSMDYVLGIVDGLSRFCLYLPCQKEITGEKVLKLVLKEWIQNFGRPNEILSDNDIRFKSSTGFYQEAMKMLGIKVSFSIPRRPQSNGLMERENRSFVQTLRCLVHETGEKNWPKLLPMVNFVMNSQISGSTGVSPSELFQGRSPWKFESVGEPCENPSVENWLMEQLLLQEKACVRLKHLRSLAMKRKNKVRTVAKYEVGQFVLVHKSRWPQRKVEKIQSPWFGPFKVVQVHFNSLMVLAFPSLGGLVKVSFSQVKHWSSVHDPHGFPGCEYFSCAEEDEESEGALGFPSTAGSRFDTEEKEKDQGAGDEHRSAGDAPEHQSQTEEGDASTEREAKEAAQTRTTRSQTRGRRSARDEAQQTTQEKVVPQQGDSSPFVPSIPAVVLDRPVQSVGDLVRGSTGVTGGPQDPGPPFEANSEANAVPGHSQGPGGRQQRAAVRERQAGAAEPLRDGVLGPQGPVVHASPPP
jgi:hypothetical protein